MLFENGSVSLEDRCGLYFAGKEFAGASRGRRCKWTSKIFAKLRSWIFHRRETGRVTAAWRNLDDRTLKDIGATRFDLEYTLLRQGSS